MARHSDTCPGPENKPYREAWDAHDAAYDAWLQQCEQAAQAATEAFTALGEGNATAEQRRAVLDEFSPPAPPESPDIACVIGDPVWCNRCRTRIRHALTDIGDLAARLEAWADGHRGAASGEKIPSRRSDAPASPSPIADTLDELYGLLAEWEAGWRTFSQHAPRPNRARTGEARERTLAYLTSQFDRIIAHPDSVKFGYGILAWQRLLQNLTKSDPVVRRRPGRCPRCDFVNTLRTRDDGYTECGECGRLLSEEEYQRDVLERAEAEAEAGPHAGRQAS